jgi:hypothetical protein
VSKQSASAKK